MYAQKFLGTQEGREFEYVLQDYLELKASIDSKKAACLKKFLYAQKLGALILLPVEGLALDGHLILFGDSDPSTYKQLILLNPSDGRILVRAI